jgi:hypothetical protein
MNRAHRYDTLAVRKDYVGGYHKFITCTGYYRNEEGAKENQCAQGTKSESAVVGETRKGIKTTDVI